MLRPITDHRGFTLVELSVVLIVLGLVIAIVSPNLNESFRTAQFDRVPTQLQSDVRLALSAAKSQGRTYRIVFSPDGYLIRDPSDSTQVLQSREFSEETRIAGSGNPLVFPWGIVQQTRIVVQGNGDNYHDLTLLPTGRITVTGGS